MFRIILVCCTYIIRIKATGMISNFSDMFFFFLHWITKDRTIKHGGLHGSPAGDIFHFLGPLTVLSLQGFFQICRCNDIYYLSIQNVSRDAATHSCFNITQLTHIFGALTFSALMKTIYIIFPQAYCH